MTGDNYDFWRENNRMFPRIVVNKLKNNYNKLYQ